MTDEAAVSRSDRQSSSGSDDDEPISPGFRCEVAAGETNAVGRVWSSRSLNSDLAPAPEQMVSVSINDSVEFGVKNSTHSF